MKKTELVRCMICDNWHLSHFRAAHVDHCSVCGVYRWRDGKRNKFRNAQGIEVVRGEPRAFHLTIAAKFVEAEA